MQFVKDKDVYKVARITGPSHNFLAIRLSDRECDTKVTQLSAQNDCTVVLTDRDVLVQVLSGLRAVNQELKKEYFISEIQFVPSDTESTSIYEYLTKELIKRIDSHGAFAGQ